MREKKEIAEDWGKSKCEGRNRINTNSPIFPKSASTVGPYQHIITNFTVCYLDDLEKPTDLDLHCLSFGM